MDLARKSVKEAATLREVTPLPRDRAIDRALSVLAATQEESGAWKGDYGGPLFLLPIYVAGLEVMGRKPDEAIRTGFLEHLRLHQNADGGWGLDVESPSLVFTTVLNYVACRLLGVGADEPMAARARAWFTPRGGPLGSASWGKFVLCLLGLYDYDGIQPVLPELYLLPKSLPIHPSRLWCHARMVYLPMAWLYGRKARAAETPLLGRIRSELYSTPYDQVDWAAARDEVAPSDLYTPRSAFLRAANALLRGYEKRHSKKLRQRALDEALEQIRGEDIATHHLCIGPINKVLNTVVWHFVNPDGPEVTAHLARLPEYLHRADDGLKMNGYNSSELWDTAFAVQAIVAADNAWAKDILTGAARFLEQNQVLEDSPDRERYDRHPSKGGWPFSTRDHGWPISDCTAEGLKASLLLRDLGLNQVSNERLEQAAELILTFQNPDGGFPTYEPQRGPTWMERLNPSDVFSTIMVDVSHVECTSACVQALIAARDKGLFSSSRRDEVEQSLRRALTFIRRTQRADGSWEGGWGVCFTYGTWFAVTALVASGATPSDPALRRAADFLKTKQRADGSWSETIESCRQRQWVEGKTGHAVNTAWAVLSLIACGEKDGAAVRNGVAWLRARQGDDGRWPPEPIAGVFNRTCAIHYDAYLRIFPLWALARARS